MTGVKNEETICKVVVDSAIRGCSFTGKRDQVAELLASEVNSVAYDISRNCNGSVPASYQDKMNFLTSAVDEFYRIYETDSSSGLKAYDAPCKAVRAAEIAEKYQGL